MNKRMLGTNEIENTLWGMALLGAGGGGSLQDGLNMMKIIKTEIALVDPADLPESANAAFVSGIGAPKVVRELGFGPEAVFAFEAMKRAVADDGLQLSYLMSGESGACATVTSLIVAALNNTPVVDADGNGRAVPEIGVGLHPIYKIPAHPLIIANKAGDIINVSLADPLDFAGAERIARAAAVAFGMLAAFSTWVVNMATIKKCLVPNGISKAEKIGRAIREAIANGKDPVKVALGVSGGKELFRGVIQKIEMKTEDGYDTGKTIIKGIAGNDGNIMVIDTKNENIIAWQDKTAVIMPPDLICLMTTDGKPLSNADIEEGMEVAVIGIPAPEPWLRIPEGFNCWKHILAKIGYEGSYVSAFDVQE